MEIIKTSIKGLLVFQPKIFEDDRGYFIEAFKSSFFDKNFPLIKFIQDNESKSSKGVLRGLHFQKPPHDQCKLVRVIEGEIIDVVLDLRSNSPTFGKWESIILSGINKKQLLVPKGFAHGFLVTSEYAIVKYKVDNEYHPSSDSGIVFNDKSLNIDWPFSTENLIISEKDRLLSTFDQYKAKPCF